MAVTFDEKGIPSGPVQVRIYPEDWNYVLRIQALTGVRAHTEIVRAALRAHLREIERGAGAPAVNVRAAKGA